MLSNLFRSNMVRWLGLLGAAILAGCTQNTQQAAAPSPSPTMVLPSPSPTATATPSPSPTSKLQTYREKSGAFEISFPKGYRHTVTKSGVAFVSADQGFAGSVDFGSADGKQLTTQQLETALKTEFPSRLKEVNWQTSQVQPDGSLRLDWTGKDKASNTLDAVSLVEQRGNSIFVLNLFGVNKPYQKYNNDAETIVNSYQIQPQSDNQTNNPKNNQSNQNSKSPKN